jgi:DNA-binding NtrC family response regulator
VVNDDAPLPTIDDVERDLIVRALERFNNDKEAAARAIGTSRRTMFRRFKAYALDVPRKPRRRPA